MQTVSQQAYSRLAVGRDNREETAVSQKITVCVQIGNSDDKLTQDEWSRYCSDIEMLLHSPHRHRPATIHFSGGSASCARWQNYCWVFEIDQEYYEDILGEIAEIRSYFRQDSVAVISGQVEFI